MLGITMRHFLSSSVYLWIIVSSSLIVISSSNHQPSYQVSLFIHLHPKGPPIHLCNGAIVQSRLVLTTATCVHYQLRPDSSLIPIPPTLLRVTAGSTSAFNDPLDLQVLGIEVSPKFNATTAASDLALIRLTAPLPLGSRDDMKWIILDDSSDSDDLCVANFVVKNELGVFTDYTQTDELSMIDNDACRRLSEYPQARNQDICSEYILPVNLECSALETFLPLNGDRGTGLVCNSRLRGILSTILKPEVNHNTRCSEMTLKAFYSRISSQLDWVYEVIAMEEYKDLAQGNHTSSAPYMQETNSIVESTATESEMTSSSWGQQENSTPKANFYHAGTGQISKIRQHIFFGLFLLISYFHTF